MKKIILLCLGLTLAISAQAKIVMEKVDYKQAEAALEGFVVYDTTFAKPGKKLPGMVIVHDWMGVGDYVKVRAEQVAKLGYVAFVADIYGKGVRPKDGKEASVLAGQYRNGDRKLLRARAEAALNELQKNKFVDTTKISAMGYCFGGTTVLEMARAGQKIKSALSFHGNLAAVSKDDAKNIKVPLLIMHGAIDPYVSPEEVATFQKELNDAGVDYQFISYSGAVHAFTEAHVGSDTKSGAAYNKKADERSTEAMKTFLAEVNK
ncbi:MAG: dienelactone hydrolase family protein [Bdellovibrio sp.]|nr:dienelactone hydrolase family protein [Bdellovibrio sp.]